MADEIEKTMKNVIAAFGTYSERITAQQAIDAFIHAIDLRTPAREPTLEMMRAGANLEFDDWGEGKAREVWLLMYDAAKGQKNADDEVMRLRAALQKIRDESSDEEDVSIAIGAIGRK